MRIACLASVYAGASDSFVRGEVAALRELGHEVLTFAVRQPDPSELVSEEIRAEHEGTEYLLSAGPATLAAAFAGWALRRPGRVLVCLRLARRLGKPGIRGRLWPLAYLLEAALLARRLREADVEHLHNHIAESSAAVAMLASTLSGTSYSFTFHGAEEVERAAELALDEKVARAKFVVAVSEYGRSQVYRWARLEDWSKVRVVRCGVSAALLRPPSPMVAERRLVVVGRLAALKGHLVLFDALAALRERERSFELEVVGDGPLRELLERRVEELGLAGSVRFSGWSSEAGVIAAIEASQALVLPSFAEGLPVALMEAMARGRPVVATAVGGVAELVAPGKNGWLVAPGSVERLGDALEELWATPPAELERLGRHGAECVAARHNRLTEAAKLVDLISQ